MQGLSPMVYGFGTSDPSDGRSRADSDSPSGSGVGSAPTPGDGRINQDVNPNGGRDAQVDDYAYRDGRRYDSIVGLTPAIFDDDRWPNDPSDSRQDNQPPLKSLEGDVRQKGSADFNEVDAPNGSGAQMGSPELEYDPIRLLGMYAQESGPLDGGLNDPIRDGNTPTRRSIARFQFTRKAWTFWTPQDFGRERQLVGEAFRGAQQPSGRMNPMDEYRLLSDGSHA